MKLLCSEVCRFAAAQIKKALDITVKLGGKGYVFWGGREGYETLLNTDVKFEQENIAAEKKWADAPGSGREEYLESVINEVMF